MGMIWPVGDSGTNITIPLLNEDNSAFEWPSVVQSVTARLTLLTNPGEEVPTLVMAGVMAHASAIVTGAALVAAGTVQGQYAVELVMVDGDGKQRRLPTEGGLRLHVRAVETP